MNKNKIDMRNSKSTMLAHIKFLENKLQKVYDAGFNGINLVSKSNYIENEQQAKSWLNKAMYKDLE